MVPILCWCDDTVTRDAMTWADWFLLFPAMILADYSWHHQVGLGQSKTSIAWHLTNESSTTPPPLADNIIHSSPLVTAAAGDTVQAPGPVARNTRPFGSRLSPLTLEGLLWRIIPSVLCDKFPPIRSNYSCNVITLSQSVVSSIPMPN